MELIDLRGEWELSQLGEERRLTAQVPGDTISALLAAGAIGDPYYGMNELALQWVGEAGWRFSKEFDVPNELVSKPLLFLHFDSIDTCAEVRLNDVPVGASRNMFVRRRFDVAKLVRAGVNRLDVIIQSPEREAAAERKRLPYPSPHNQFPIQSQNRNLIRKVQCHSGWDWGPCLMVSGIYGSVYLGAAGSHRIDYVHTRTKKRNERSWELEVTVEIWSAREGVTTVVAAVSGKASRKEVVLAAGAQTLALSLLIDNPELWWPSGYGEQPLYDLTVATDDDEVHKRVAFRTLEVVAEDDQRGRSMTFRVNGRPLFCKGANWIPTDALPLRQTRERYRDLLDSAVDAHMNMLRVWGGGQYEVDEFYDMCDERGLLIWQDFMFSCSTYPGTKEFLAEVKREVVHQVKRLKDHPCIALWCGNNENLGALTWYPETRERRDRYLVDYDRLYEGTIGDTVAVLDPDRTYWPSSPSGGRGDYSDGWHNDSRGDMHFWSVWHEGKPFSAYYDVTPRFCSEFGFQSFSSPSTVATYADGSMRNLTAPVMEHHQRHPRGNSIIIESLSRYYRFPEAPDDLLYLSQVQQAFAIRTAVDFWRARRPDCMGALYWQLNDLWPGASWSSIEYGGKWKLLHYAAKRFYAPVYLSAFIAGEQLELWGCNDQSVALKGRFSLDFVSFGGTLKESRTQETTLKADASTLIASIDLRTLGFSREEHFVRCVFRSKELVVENDLLLDVPKRCELQLPAITIGIGSEETKEGGEGPRAYRERVVELVLDTDRPAFSVSLDPGARQGRFDDNCFTLLPGKAHIVRFTYGADEGEYPPTAEWFTLRHLRGTYA